MRLHRVNASALHSWYHLSHSLETWIDLFWFSLIDIFVFGLISSFFVGSVAEANFLIAGIIIWEIVRIGQYTVTVGMLWEIWSKSFSSLFTSPLTIWEFIAGQSLSGFVKSVVVTFVVSVIGYFMFGFNIAVVGWVLVLYFLILFTFSIAAGIFLLSLIIRYGTDIQSLAWGLIYLVQPISALFYPVEVLPQGVRLVAYLSPITYIMESVRSQLNRGQILWSEVVISLFLSLFYLIISILITKRAIARSKETGAFARMGS